MKYKIIQENLKTGVDENDINNVIEIEASSYKENYLCNEIDSETIEYYGKFGYKLGDKINIFSSISFYDDKGIEISSFYPIFNEYFSVLDEKGNTIIEIDLDINIDDFDCECCSSTGFGFDCEDNCEDDCDCKCDKNI